MLVDASPDPSREGQQIATARFVPFLNRAVRRAGLVEGQEVWAEQPAGASTRPGS